MIERKFEKGKQDSIIVGKYRWTVCGLLFFATTVNYIDRALISSLKPYLATSFGWDAVQEVSNYTDIEISFKISYAIGMLFAGYVVDKLGTKIGYALATFLWSIAAVVHALATGAIGFVFARIFLGVTEAANFPAAIKTTAEWFPKKERALATGIFNSGTNIGAILAPLIVPVIADNLGWQWAFIITGALGFVWLILWFRYYEIPLRQKRLGDNELAYIQSDKDEYVTPVVKLSWFKLLHYKQTWAFAIGKFLTDPIWWFYLFWLPDFLRKEYGLTTRELMGPITFVYVFTSIGSIFGGWIPLRLIGSGMPVFRARKASMFIFALFVIPIVFVQQLGELNMWLGVSVISLAAASHQAWSANIFTTVSDMFPKISTASVTGIGSFFGGLGGILLSWLVQKRLFVYYESIGQIRTGYFIMFLICGGAYLLAWTFMHLLTPKMKSIDE